MGKANRNKKSKTNKKKVEQVDNQSNENQVQDPSFISPIVKKLIHEDESERAYAATAISHLVQEVDNQKLLMSANVIPQLLSNIQLMSKMTLLECLGSLSNVLLFIGHDASINCIKNNGLHIILNIFPNIINEIKLVMEGTQETDDDKVLDPYAVAEQALSCLWNMSEASDEAVQTLTSLDMLNFVMSLLSSPSTPWSLLRVAAQFLNTLSDDNLPLSHLIADNLQYFNTLLNIVKNDEFGWVDCKIDLRVLCASILHNFKSALVFDDQLPLYTAIVHVISQCLEYDLVAGVPVVEQAGLEVDKVKSSVSMTETVQQMGDLDLFNPDNKNTALIASKEAELATIQLSLEILANIYSEDIADEIQKENLANEKDVVEDEEDAMEADAEEDDEDEMFEMMDEEHEEAENLRITQLSALLFQKPSPIINRILYFATLPSLTLTSPACQSYVKHFDQVRVRALAALSNLFLINVTKSWSETHPKEISNLWATLWQSATTIASQTPLPLDLFETYIMALWALARSVHKTANAIVVTDDQVQWMMQGCMQSPESIKTKIIAMLSLFSQSESNIPLNKKMIGEWMMTLLQQSASVAGPSQIETISELLNSIFDIYSDGRFTYDQPVFIQLQFNSILRDCYPRIALKVKSVDKRKFKEVRARADEAVLNLREFIKYKDSEVV
ncbi:armadillo-type protein, partial [Globomyces pollinis-pini]